MSKFVFTNLHHKEELLCRRNEKETVFVGINPNFCPNSKNNIRYPENLTGYSHPEKNNFTKFRIFESSAIISSG